MHRLFYQMNVDYLHHALYLDSLLSFLILQLHGSLFLLVEEWFSEHYYLRKGKQDFHLRKHPLTNLARFLDQIVQGRRQGQHSYFRQELLGNQMTVLLQVLLVRLLGNQMGSQQIP